MNGKYRAKHNDECRSRFEAILLETEAGKKRFDAARERRLEGITKKAMESEEKFETPKAPGDHSIPTPPAAGTGVGASSGSGLSGDQRN